MKPQDEVIQEFNVQNNMTVDELQAWLNNPQSKKAGTGVGIESGNKIVEILKKNPSKDPELYDDEDIQHMRKVVGYNKRHMAQEDHLKETKTKEELENTKSTISMKNWGHDPVKSLDEEKSGGGKETEEITQDAESTPAVEVVDEQPAKSELMSSVGSKRKLADTAGDAPGEQAEQANKNAQADETTVDEGEAEQDEASEERARKKSKTVDTEVEETANQDVE